MITLDSILIMFLFRFQRFIDLPYELRNIIYQRVMTEDRVIRIVYPARVPTTSSPSFLAILRVSKQLNTEARPFFYSQNVFQVGNGKAYSGTECNLPAFRRFLYYTPNLYLNKIPWVTVEPMSTKVPQPCMFSLETPWGEVRSSVGCELYENLSELMMLVNLIKLRLKGIKNNITVFDPWAGREHHHINPPLQRHVFLGHSADGKYSLWLEASLSRWTAKSIHPGL